MRACLQRVRRASVAVDGRVVGRISHGLLILLAVGEGDTRDDAAYLCNKILQLRIFEDEQGKMNRSVRDVGGELLVVSQFTLYGDCRRGRRPSFSRAASPELAADLFAAVIELLQEAGVRVAQGVFRAHMNVELVNDGPVTLLLESPGGDERW